MNLNHPPEQLRSRSTATSPFQKARSILAYGSTALPKGGYVRRAPVRRCTPTLIYYSHTIIGGPVATRFTRRTRWKACRWRARPDALWNAAVSAHGEVQRVVASTTRPGALY